MNLCSSSCFLSPRLVRLLLLLAPMITSPRWSFGCLVPYLYSYSSRCKASVSYLSFILAPTLEWVKDRARDNAGLLISRMVRLTAPN